MDCARALPMSRVRSPFQGLDPETRRAMWSLIDIAKAGRSIVLTTHSMEEADALCGRIGIMAYGSLRCLGPSLHLKRRFGDGFRVEVTHRDGGADAERRAQITTRVEDGPALLLGDAPAARERRATEPRSSRASGGRHHCGCSVWHSWVQHTCVVNISCPCCIVCWNNQD